MIDRQEYPNEHLIRFMARYYEGCEAKVLDIGCGIGGNTWFLAERGHDVTGIDISRDAIMVAKLLLHRRGVKACLVNGDAIKWPSGSYFDCIVDINTLCHVESRFDFYSNLKDGGRVFQITPMLGTWDGVKDGKKYTLLSSEHVVRESFVGFGSVKIGRLIYSDGDHEIRSWIAEATK